MENKNRYDPDRDERSGRIKLDSYGRYLRNQEKAENTVQKYMRDAEKLLRFLNGRAPTIELLLAYKEGLSGQYRISSINSMLVAANAYLRFLGREDCCVRTYRMQRRIFCEEGRELGRAEYERLVRTARRQGKQRLAGILQTIGMTGIRVGELQYITVEAVERRMVEIYFKNKLRVILLPVSLSRMLSAYCRQRNIRQGPVFMTRGGRPVNRRNIWASMKRLCTEADVPESKVFPHNLRHLFARCYYEKEKDIVRLADYLGHSSLETTRRYTAESSMRACLRQLEMGLLIREEDCRLKHTG